MKNTAAVRKENINHIRQIVAGGGEHTVKSLTELTGLCAATCNSILKYLVSRGEVVGTPCQMNDVGRSTTVYKMNSECASVMYLRCVVENGRHIVHITVLYLFGALRAFDDIDCGNFSAETLAGIINSEKEKYTGLNSVLLGISQGDTEGISKRLEQLTGIQVYVKLNVEYFAYGVWSARSKQGETVVLALPQGESWQVYISLDGNIVNGINGKKQGALVEEEGLADMLATACALAEPDRVCIVGASEKLQEEIMSVFLKFNCEIGFERDLNYRFVVGMSSYARYIVFNSDNI